MSWDYVPLTAIRSVEDAEAFVGSMRRFAREHWADWKADLEPRSCPVCGHDDPEPAEPFAESFEVSRCRFCRSLYVNPVPSRAQLQLFYRQAEPIRILNSIYAKRNSRGSSFVNDTRMLKVLECLVLARDLGASCPSVLEIGCNNGGFLHSLATAADSAGITLGRIVGIDVDDSVLPSNPPEGVEFLATDAHDAADRADLDSAFDLVVHFELIEHLPDPSAFMAAAESLLKPGGFMVFTTPNAVGLEMELAGYNDYRLMSHGIFPPMHLNAFSTFNISLFAVRCGFRVISVETPGKLDVDCAVRYQLKTGNTEPVFAYLSEQKPNILGWLQALIARLRASSTLLVVLQRVD